jgi:glutathione S-transferase
MHQLKLTYFDINGGRGEPARLALNYAKIAFEDYRFPFSELGEVKKTTPMGQVPTLLVDGKLMTQCNSINRFVGKLAGLFPEDTLQAFLCDEIMDLAEDSINKIVATFSMTPEVQKETREALVGPDGNYTKCLTCLATRLKEQGGDYFVENRLTMADLKVYVWVRSLNSGVQEHIPNDLVERVAPSLNAHFQRIDQTPEIAAYYQSKA